MCPTMEVFFNSYFRDLHDCKIAFARLSIIKDGIFSMNMIISNF